MQLAYYPGCSLQQSSALYDVQSRRIFSELGAELIEIDDWNCCGATSAGKVDDFMAAAMPARNIGIAERAGFSEMVIPCSACYSRTLVAQKRMEDDAALKEEINGELGAKVNGSLKISSILEALEDRVEAGTLKDRVVHKMTGLRPVCYYGCMMTRFPYAVAVPDDVENPQGMERILKALKIKAVDWNYKTACCGASAAVNDPETSHNLMARIMKDAVIPRRQLFRDDMSHVPDEPRCPPGCDLSQKRHRRAPARVFHYRDHRRRHGHSAGGAADRPALHRRHNTLEGVGGT